MFLTIESINTFLWIGLAIALLITWLVRKAQIANWKNGVDIKVRGCLPFRPQEVRNKDIFFEGALYVLYIIDIAFFIFAVGTIPAY